MSRTAAHGARRVRRDGEKGFVLVWFALMMVVLLAIGGLALDFSNWYLVGTHEQKAADAASLAGAVFLPENTNNDGVNKALDIAKQNGFASGVTATPVPGKPSQMQVTITTRVKNFLAEVLGFDTQTVTKTAIAEYERPVAMGSPNNQFGNDPETGTPGTPTYPNFWANAAGPSYEKHYGDAYLSANCNASPEGVVPDNCTSNGGTNLELDPKGYYYAVRATQGGALKFEAFDPGFVHVGTNCTGGAPVANGPQLPNLDSRATDIESAFGQLAARAFFPGYPAAPVPSPKVVYSPGGTPNGDRYCTGDRLTALQSDPLDPDPTHSPNPPSTTFTVLGPAQVLGNPGTATPIAGCTKTFPGVKAMTPLGLVTNLTQNVKVGPDRLASWFRQWYPLCTATVQAGEDYFIQVTTSNGAGENHFSLRATGVSNTEVFGNERMSIYGNFTAPGSFYLARIVPAGIDRDLVLSFYDIGDASSSGQVTVLPPSDPGASIGECTYTPPRGNQIGPPWGRFDGRGCTFSVNYASFNAQWIQVKVPIPNTYTCNFTDTINGCWFRIQFSFKEGPVFDTTTWTASLSGDPVRIIK